MLPIKVIRETAIEMLFIKYNIQRQKRVAWFNKPPSKSRETRGGVVAQAAALVASENVILFVAFVLLQCWVRTTINADARRGLVVHDAATGFAQSAFLLPGARCGRHNQHDDERGNLHDCN